MLKIKLELQPTKPNQTKKKSNTHIHTINCYKPHAIILNKLRKGWTGANANRWTVSGMNTIIMINSVFSQTQTNHFQMLCNVCLTWMASANWTDRRLTFLNYLEPSDYFRCIHFKGELFFISFHSFSGNVNCT